MGPAPGAHLADELAEYLAANEGMPDGHYAKFGGEDLPGYPEVWQERIP